MDSVKNVVAKFRDRGLKITPQRIAIFHALQKKINHPSADEIFRSIRLEYPSISLTTVYKTLETLREIGEIHELHVSKERVLYDPKNEPHHHLICLKCSHIADVPGSQVVELKAPKPLSHKFSLIYYRVHFYGFCGRCKRAAHA